VSDVEKARLLFNHSLGQLLQQMIDSNNALLETLEGMQAEGANDDDGVAAVGR
jgi:hypothetical protein